MCQSQAQGGRRCAAHTHLGLATNQHAREVTNLDGAQVSSIFQRLRSTAGDTPAPLGSDAKAALVRLRREVLDDPRLDDRTAERIADRYARAIEDVDRGEIPDGRTWLAAQKTVLEAEIAQRNLDKLLAASARSQRTDLADLAARFYAWRRNDDYEDCESPDPTFRPDPDHFPHDKDTQRALRKLGYENYLSQQLPVFVYGTLRNNQGNDRLMRGAIAWRSEEAQVEGVAVYGANRGFPYAQEAPDGQGATRGDLVYLADDQSGDYARQRLDSLEGFDSDRPSTSHYRRLLKDVTFPDPETGELRTQKAWIYLAGTYAQRSLREEDRIPHGDWVRARKENTEARIAANHARRAAEDDEAGYKGGYVVRKSATDPTPARSAQDSAEVFSSAGLLDEEPDENAAFWSQHR